MADFVSSVDTQLCSQHKYVVNIHGSSFALPTNCPGICGCCVVAAGIDNSGALKCGSRHCLTCCEGRPFIQLEGSWTVLLLMSCSFRFQSPSMGFDRYAMLLRMLGCWNQRWGLVAWLRQSLTVPLCGLVWRISSGSRRWNSSRTFGWTEVDGISS